MNSATLIGEVVSKPIHKVTNSGQSKLEFYIDSPTKLGKINIFVIAFGKLCDSLTSLREGDWGVFTGSLEGSQRPYVEQLTFAIVLRDFFRLEVPAEQVPEVSEVVSEQK